MAVLFKNMDNSCQFALAKLSSHGTLALERLEFTADWRLPADGVIPASLRVDP